MNNFLNTGIIVDFEKIRGRWNRRLWSLRLWYNYLIFFKSYKIKISYTPNIARSGQTSLRLEMWDSESEAIFFPIIYSGKIADLTIKPPVINIGFCFINLPYRQNISIENESDIDGYFYIIPQSVSICTLNINITFSLRNIF